MKKWLIFSLVLIVAGAIMFCVQVGGADWDFEKLDTEKVTEMNFTTQNNQEIQAEGVTKVSVKIHSTKFKLTRSGTEFSLRYYESDIYTYDIGLQEGTLRFHENRNGWKQFLRMFTGFKRSKLTTELVIPENYAGELDITCANGDLSLDGGAYDSLSMRTTNGSVNISNLTAAHVTAKSTNGAITLQNVRGEEITMETTNGVLSALTVTADTLAGKTTNGEVTLSQSETKECTLKTTNGEIIVAASRADHLRADTTNGDVQVSLLGTLADYKIDGETSRHAFAGNQPGNGSGKSVTVRTTNGDIRISIS